MCGQRELNTIKRTKYHYGLTAYIHMFLPYCFFYFFVDFTRYCEMICVQVLINGNNLMDLFSSRRVLEEDAIVNKVAKANDIHQSLLSQISEQEKVLKVSSY